MTLTRTLSLSALAAEVCDDNPSVADPNDLAELMLDRIDPSDYKEALRLALHRYVTTFVVSTRPTRGADEPSAPPQTGRKIGRSRLTGVGDFLSSREFSPHRGEWILLAEATVDDLRAMAEKRAQTAAMYAAKAQWYSDMADLVFAHEVTTVGELPAKVQAALMAGTPTL